MFDFLGNSKSYKITVIVLGVFVLGALIIAMNPAWRDRAQGFFKNQDRMIIAKSSGLLNQGGPFLTVFKIKTKDGLFIEVYKEAAESHQLMSKLPLEGTQDGFFNFQNQATNLALTDIDEDGYIDIVAPTFDERQQARMNIYQYDVNAETYVRLEKEN